MSLESEPLVLQRPLVAFDVETTGLDVNQDRIVEIACIKMHPDGRRECRVHRINPTVPIGASATAIHGISDQDVAHEPTFAQLAPQLLAFMSGCDLTGFNIEQFDLPLLRREFARIELTFPPAPVHVIDSWRIFLRKEPRDLTAAYRFYCDRPLAQAHSAEADARAAADILVAQVGRYSDVPGDAEGLHTFCHPQRPDWIDPDGKIIWRDGEAVLTFGKNRHRSLRALAAEDPDYLRWVAKANFSDAVVKLVNEALAGRFPQAQAAAAAAVTPERRAS